ncbi:uncharacterized protein G2W53_024887 [Senna tora]|uniref:Uncharacterized protein n=1 Tax=Senna tora TaxID=362788 RepID=A0A834TC88_9FABA|nr:uncharacterized protein G2W53_024887 [Senna tora]
MLEEKLTTIQHFLPFLAVGKTKKTWRGRELVSRRRTAVLRRRDTPVKLQRCLDGSEKREKGWRVKN